MMCCRREMVIARTIQNSRSMRTEVQVDFLRGTFSHTHLTGIECIFYALGLV